MIWYDICKTWVPFSLLYALQATTPVENQQYWLYIVLNTSIKISDISSGAIIHMGEGYGGNIN